ncbi:hypothetical protein ACODGV_12270 [Vagococcus fluvialis]|uniref:hypothetical protein n=1 Tax=Vagococcus fluvialis TaxID=2738 RepID=UPI003B219C12
MLSEEAELLIRMRAINEEYASSPLTSNYPIALLNPSKYLVKKEHLRKTQPKCLNCKNIFDIVLGEYKYTLRPYYPFIEHEYELIKVDEISFKSCFCCEECLITFTKNMAIDSIQPKLKPIVIIDKIEEDVKTTLNNNSY